MVHIFFYLEAIKSMRDLTISLIVKFGDGGFSWSIPNITVEVSSSAINYNILLIKHIEICTLIQLPQGEGMTTRLADCEQMFPMGPCK